MTRLTVNQVSKNADRVRALLSSDLDAVIAALNVIEAADYALEHRHHEVKNCLATSECVAGGLLSKALARWSAVKTDGQKSNG